MNSDFLLAQPNRSCFLIGSHGGELIYAALVQATFVLFVLLLAVLVPLEQCAQNGARAHDTAAVFMSLGAS
jgi:hypothetical protein